MLWGGWPCLLAVWVQSKGQASDPSSAHPTLGIDLKQKLHVLKSLKFSYWAHPGFSSSHGA